MPAYSERIEAALVETAWSQWTELGVRGTVRNHGSWSIDPEALVVLTSTLADADPRLRDESLDWCSRFHRYLSRSRLRNVVRAMDDESQAAYHRYAATLVEAGVRGWPAVGEPWPFEPSSKSQLADLQRPALLRIRLRAIFGVSTRTEILHVLAWQSADWASSGDIATFARYTKRNVDDALDNLVRAGLVASVQSGNRRVVRIEDGQVLERFVGAVPDHFIDWVEIFATVTGVRRLVARTRDADPRVRDVEASRMVDALTEHPRLGALHSLPPTGPSAWERLAKHGVQMAEQLAAGRRPSSWDGR